MSQAGHPARAGALAPLEIPHSARWAMGRILLVLLILVFIVIGGGFAYLATRDMPPPTSTIEREIPNERLVP